MSKKNVKMFLGDKEINMAGSFKMETGTKSCPECGNEKIVHKCFGVNAYNGCCWWECLCCGFTDSDVTEEIKELHKQSFSYRKEGGK